MDLLIATTSLPMCDLFLTTLYDLCCCEVCQDHQLCSGMSPTEAACIQEEIKAFLDLDFASDDVLGMLELSECESRSVGEVCLPAA